MPKTVTTWFHDIAEPVAPQTAIVVDGAKFGDPVGSQVDYFGSISEGMKASDVASAILNPDTDFAAHMPGSVSVVSDRAFAAESEDGWWGPSEYWGLFDIDSVSSTPSLDSKSGRILYPNGTPDGQGAAATGRTFADASEVYIALYHKFESWVAHPVGTKIGFIKSVYYGGGGDPAIIQATSNPWFYRVALQGPSIGGSLAGGLNLNPNTGYSPTFGNGEWVKIEIYAKLHSSAGFYDGWLDMWINDQKSHEYRDILWSNGPVYPFTAIEYQLNWGGDLPDTYAPQNMYSYVDRWLTATAA